MALTKNRAVLAWIDEMAAMTQPDQLVWIDGSEAQLEELRKQACASGEIERLNEEKLPGCYLHRTAVNDVARVEDRTFICCKKQEDAGPTNHWMDPQEMYAKLKKLYTGAMKGRTMYVIPYSMGVVGSPLRQVRHRADRLHLCGAQHGHHDPGRPGRGRRDGRRLCQGAPRQGGH